MPLQEDVRRLSLKNVIEHYQLPLALDESRRKESAALVLSFLLVMPKALLQIPTHSRTYPLHSRRFDLQTPRGWFATTPVSSLPLSVIWRSARCAFSGEPEGTEHSFFPLPFHVAPASSRQH